MRKKIMLNRLLRLEIIVSNCLASVTDLGLHWNKTAADEDKLELLDNYHEDLSYIQNELRSILRG